jgi:DNA modification methylase
MSNPDKRIVVPDAVIKAVLSQDRVVEAPHNFYKYPARFSPFFAREVIKAFSVPGETVLDPFCGGGTALIEAISLGRRAAGFDISSLATFISRAKTTPISVHDKREIQGWIGFIDTMELPTWGPSPRLDAAEDHYQRNLPETARIAFVAILDSVKHLQKERQRRLVRLVLLSVGQWALDCKTAVPTWEELRTEFSCRLRAVLMDHFDFLGRVAMANGLPRCRLTETRRVINRSSEESGEDGRIPDQWLPAKLVVTSPPYPGVHVVYHRWQIHGRKETPAPFWLANAKDGEGEAFYSLGRRDEPQLTQYFERLSKVFASVRGLLDHNSMVVQMVAFSKPEWQLPVFLRKLEEAGFLEMLPDCNDEFLFEGRIWRHVPGRKWYANKRGDISASKEVMLFHRLDRLSSFA